MWQDQELCEMPTVLKKEARKRDYFSWGNMAHQKSSGLQLNLTDFELLPEPEVKCPF